VLILVSSFLSEPAVSTLEAFYRLRTHGPTLQHSVSHHDHDQINASEHGGLRTSKKQDHALIST
jgi:hypothetical protein